MVREIRDENTGIIRFEVGVANAALCRKAIEESGLVLLHENAGSSVNYLLSCDGEEIQISADPGRAVFFGKNYDVMKNVLDKIRGNGDAWTSWAYDGSQSKDYHGTGRLIKEG